jgi:hypothetical protein
MNTAHIRMYDYDAPSRSQEPFPRFSCCGEILTLTNKYLFWLVCVSLLQTRNPHNLRDGVWCGTVVLYHDLDDNEI